jgi:putative FmdB family regulatory protein
LEGIVPIYEYRCSSCGFQNEYLRKVSDPLLSVCPECSKESFSKMLTAAGFQLKGAGWYVTDFKNSGAKPSAKSSGQSEGGAVAESKTETLNESKSESRNESKNESKNGGKRDGKRESKTEARPAVAAAPAAPASTAKAE